VLDGLGRAAAAPVAAALSFDPMNAAEPQPHNAEVVPMGDGFAASCPCGWSGDTYADPIQAEIEAGEHEAGTMR